MASKLFRSSAFRTVTPVLAGFGIGWAGVTAIERSDTYGAHFTLWTAVQTLRLQTAIAANVLVPANLVPQNPPTGDAPAPHPFVRRVFLANRGSLEELREVLEAVEHQLQMYREDNASKEAGGNSAEKRVPFTKLLRECRVYEQCDWLLDHATEEIPFFYIGDVYNSWVTNHYEAAAVAAGAPSKDSSLSERDVELLRENCAGRVFGPPMRLEAYDNAELTLGVWRRVVQGVLSFDVGVQALALLVTSNTKNAETLVRRARAVIKDIEVTVGDGAADDSAASAQKTVVRREVFEVSSEAAHASAELRAYVAPFGQALLELSRKYHYHLNEKIAALKEAQGGPADEAATKQRVAELEYEQLIVSAAIAQVLRIATFEATKSSWWNIVGQLRQRNDSVTRGGSHQLVERAARGLQQRWNPKCGDLRTLSEESLCGPVRSSLRRAQSIQVSGVHSSAFVPADAFSVLEGQVDGICRQMRCKD